MDDKGERERALEVSLWPRRLADQLVVNEEVFKRFRQFGESLLHSRASRRGHPPPTEYEGRAGMPLYGCTDNILNKRQGKLQRQRHKFMDCYKCEHLSWLCALP